MMVVILLFTWKFWWVLSLCASKCEWYTKMKGFWCILDCPSQSPCKDVTLFRLFVCAQVEFSVENSTFHLLVDGVRVPDGQLPGNEGLSLRLRNPVYLGGHPKTKTTKVHIKLEQSYHSLLICIFLLTTATKLKKNNPSNMFIWKVKCFREHIKRWPRPFLFGSSGTRHSRRQRHRLFTGFQNE